MRIPASYCGVYAMKASHGLVPYTKIMPIELTIDHTGPITANVSDNALMLEVLTGPDGLDPRQHACREAQPYTELMKAGVKGLKIGIVSEDFGWPNSMPELDAQVRKAAKRFSELGAKVAEVCGPVSATAPSTPGSDVPATNMLLRCMDFLQYQTTGPMKGRFPARRGARCRPVAEETSRTHVVFIARPRDEASTVRSAPRVRSPAG